MTKNPNELSELIMIVVVAVLAIGLAIGIVVYVKKCKPELREPPSINIKGILNEYIIRS